MDPHSSLAPLAKPRRCALKDHLDGGGSAVPSTRRVAPRKIAKKRKNYWWCAGIGLRQNFARQQPLTS